MKSLKYILVSLFVSTVVYANGNTPDCMASGQTLATNDAQVINWKNTTQNQFQSRGHILGTLIQQYPDHSGHHHFEVKIGSHANDTIEVIYNEDFGKIPQVSPGAQIEACGDYITSTKQSGRYPASPDGAILHWVHQSNNSRHESGFLIIDGILYGQNAANAGPKRHGKHLN